MSIIVGTAEADVLRGTGGADRIFGRGGDDDIAGRGGGDLLVGGAGADILDGGPGADTLVGGTEDQSLDGGAGFDTARFDGTGGADGWLVGTGLAFDNPGVFVFDLGGESGARVPLSGVERLEFDGGAGADRLVVEEVFGTYVVSFLEWTVRVVGPEGLTFDGGGGDDTLDGAAANGPLFGRGGEGDDRLTGGSRDDVLSGGSGDDVLVGGPGADVLTGGAGADVFRFLAEDDLGTPDGRVGLDRITDFSRAQGDQIDLGGIDADVTAPGDQAFLFADGLRFIRYQPGLLTTEIDRDEGVTYVSLDTGSGTNKVLAVEGRIEFTAADFTL